MNPVWIILGGPLLAAAVILLLTPKRPVLSAALAVAASLTSFGLSLWLFAELRAGRLEALAPAPLLLVDAGAWQIVLGALLDRFSVLLLLVVTGVGSAIQVYSLGYMRGDRGYARYFGGMALFMFAMIGIVLAENFIQMFIFWELVGLASWLLIGFWFERPAAAAAAKKAFIVNRIGDFGFLLGIALIGVTAGSLRFADLARSWPGLVANAPGLATGAALLILCGAIGKSAQLPLHVWLPDAMEGPTPVSALIHAATMVAAGVFMLCRVFWVLAPSPTALTVVAWLGALTALGAALIAVTQCDLKRILAYSTLSQLGYMVMAVGLGGTVPALFHLTTHAFFKALLFLGAGSVILALHHQQDIWKMGGLARRVPWTTALFAVGALALAGVWPLSGFYSKDEILLLGWHQHAPVFWLAVLTAGLTAFYLGRLFLVAFLGAPRDAAAHAQAKEAPLVMLLPMAVLAVLSISGGWAAAVPEFLAPEPAAAAPPHAAGLVWALLAVPLLGFGLAYAVYGRRPLADEPLRRTFGAVYTLVENGFQVDAFYLWLVRRVQGGVAAGCQFVDRRIVQGLLAGGAAALSRFAGAVVCWWQGGSINRGAFTFATAVILVIWLLLMGGI